MIKPEAVESNFSGSILKMIEERGFIIKAIKMVHLTKQKASEFYLVHKDRPFYDDLVEYMSSGPIIAAVLERENAVFEFRNLIGSTDPSEAEPNTIRAIFAESKAKNAVHGSDSDDNAKIEANFHFSSEEIF